MCVSNVRDNVYLTSWKKKRETTFICNCERKRRVNLRSFSDLITRLRSMTRSYNIYNWRKRCRNDRVMARMVIVRAALIDRKNDGNNCGVRNYENRFPWNFPLEFPWMEDSDLKRQVFHFWIRVMVGGRERGGEERALEKCVGTYPPTFAHLSMSGRSPRRQGLPRRYTARALCSRCRHFYANPFSTVSCHPFH